MDQHDIAESSDHRVHLYVIAKDILQAVVSYSSKKVLARVALYIYGP